MFSDAEFLKALKIEPAEIEEPDGAFEIAFGSALEAATYHVKQSDRWRRCARRALREGRRALDMVRFWRLVAIVGWGAFVLLTISIAVSHPEKKGRKEGVYAAGVESRLLDTSPNRVTNEQHTSP